MSDAKPTVGFDRLDGSSSAMRADSPDANRGFVVAPGVLLGRYRLERALGRGGMAEVWLARDTALDREVAVKTILPVLAADPDLRERFLREARLAAGLDHPHIVPVFDAGEDRGIPYAVMPQVSGGTLAARISAGAPRWRAVAWIVHVAAALDAAHAAGVLHRDVKPGNVLLGHGDRALLADFGIASLAQAATRLTATGLVVGTPAYMAPELARGERATPESDRYALAVLAWELLAGEPPYRGESALSVLHQHVSAPVPLLSASQPDTPPALAAALEVGLAKAPESRPPSCVAFAEQLLAALPAVEADLVRGELATGSLTPPGGRSTVRNVGVTTSSSGVAEGAATVRFDSGHAAVAQRVPPAQPARSVASLLAAVLATVAVGLLAGTLWWNRSGDPDRVPTPETLAPTGRQAEETSIPAAAAPDRATTSLPAAGRPELVADRPWDRRPPDRRPADRPPSAATPLGSGSEVDQAVPPGDARRLLRVAADLLRPGRSLAAADFHNLRELGAELERREAGNPEVASQRATLAELANGGEALLAQDRAAAVAAAARLRDLARGDFRGPPWLAALLGTTEAEPTDWQLAALFGDPLGNGLGLLAGDPGAPSRDLGLLVLSSHAGQHARALEVGTQLFAASGVAGRGALAAILVGEASAVDDQVGVDRWFAALLAEPLGRDPRLLRGLAELVGRDSGKLQRTRELLTHGCASGVAQLCGGRPESAGRPNLPQRRGSEPRPGARRAGGGG